MKQRKYLNESQISISDILKEWPILFIHEYMLWHYEKLLDRSIERISENFKMKKWKILEFGKQNKLCVESEWNNEASAAL